jgi:hypothetical protein
LTIIRLDPAAELNQLRTPIMWGVADGAKRPG